MSFYISIFYIVIKITITRPGVLRRSQACNCKHDGLWVRVPFEEMKLLIFSFNRSGNETNRGVEFRRSTRSIILNSVESGERKSLNGNGESYH